MLHHGLSLGFASWHDSVSQRNANLQRVRRSLTYLIHAKTALGLNSWKAACGRHVRNGELLSKALERQRETLAFQSAAVARRRPSVPAARQGNT